MRKRLLLPTVQLLIHLLAGQASKSRPTIFRRLSKRPPFRSRFNRNLILSKGESKDSGRSDMVVLCVSLRGGNDNDDDYVTKTTRSELFNGEESDEPVLLAEIKNSTDRTILSEMIGNSSESISSSAQLPSASLISNMKIKVKKEQERLKKSIKKIIVNNTNDNNVFQDGSFDDGDDDEVTHQSDLMRPGRQMFVVTTAAIPWFTGTAVNPLLRATYLFRMTKKINENATSIVGNETLPSDVLNTTANEGETSLEGGLGESSVRATPVRMVTLVIPWLELEEDRLELYGPDHNFSTPQEQEVYIRTWLREQANMPEEADAEFGLKIMFYPARYHSGLKSIFAMGDIPSLIPDRDADVCILEEPEHLNWFRAPEDGWTKKFKFVVGIIHTNYVEYASAHYSGLWTAPAIRAMSSAMVRAYCHVVIKLSDTLQNFAEEKEKTSNVHGVRSEFLKEGERRASMYDARDKASNRYSQDIPPGATRKACSKTPFPAGTKKKANAYFIGKILWTKGLDKMLEMEKYYRHCAGDYFPIDIYGSGPEEKEIIRAFQGRNHRRNASKNTLQFDTNSSTFSGDEDAATTSSQITYISDLENLSEQEEIKLEGKYSPFSEHVARISERIQSTTKTIKSTTESLEFDLPMSRHEWRKSPIPASFPGRVDHAILKDYDVFINPSLSEVLCTTTAEALAMGKFVIIPVHPSNTFFMQFPNCLAYRNKFEFSSNLHWALSHDPAPLSLAERRIFTWEAASERLVQASAITRLEARDRQLLGNIKLDERIAWFHNEIGKGAMGDTLRRLLGVGLIFNESKSDNGKKIVSDENKFSSSDETKETESLARKFVGSPLVEAIRKTFANSSPVINL